MAIEALGVRIGYRGLATVADPTQLETAADNILSSGMITAYGVLNVGAMAAGDAYTDPASSTKIIKLSDSTFPASDEWYGSYPLGGTNVSLPWGDGGKMRTVALGRDSNGEGWLLDVDTTKNSGATSNGRQLDEVGTRMVRGILTFSNVKATPQICYTRNVDSKIHRFDTAIDALADTGNFPSGDCTYELFLWSCDILDRYFLNIDFSGSTGFEIWDHTIGGAGGTFVRTEAKAINQGEISGDGRHVLVCLDGSNKSQSYDRVDDAYSADTTNVTQDHNAVVGATATAVFADGDIFSFGLDDDVESLIYDISALNMAERNYLFGQWMHDNDDDWFGYNQDGLVSAQTLVGGRSISIGNLAGDTLRHLCHPYHDNNQSGQRDEPTFSADGKCVLFTSNMDNDGGRNDCFLAILPTKAA